MLVTRKFKARLGSNLEGQGTITRAEWSPDGLTMVIVVQANWAIVWEVDSQVARPMQAFGDQATFSPDGAQLMVATMNGRFVTCDAKSGAVIDEVKLSAEPGLVGALAWRPQGDVLAVARLVSRRGTPHLTVEAVDPRGWTPLWRVAYRLPRESAAGVPSVARWAPDGSVLAVHAGDERVFLLSPRGKRVGVMSGHVGGIRALAWRPDGSELAAASSDATVRIWTRGGTRPSFVLERHTAGITSCSYSSDGTNLASIDMAGEALVWDTGDWRVRERAAPATSDSSRYWIAAFHPRDPRLLAKISTSGELEIAALDTGASPVPTSRHYVNATVLLVGDTGVGKSGLGLVLSGNRFEATESTHGRRIWVLGSSESNVDGHDEIREIFLWDLAGQPGYRLLHQLHLAQADLALVVFDSRSETDPFTGVRYWARALRQVGRLSEGEDSSAIRFLVAARLDGESVAVSRDRVDDVVASYGFEAYFETSAKEGWNIPELASAVRSAVPWDRLPRVSSSELFLSIKSFLVSEKEAGRLIATPRDLLASYRRALIGPQQRESMQVPEQPMWRQLLGRDEWGRTEDVSGEAFLRRELGNTAQPDELFQAFDTCIGRVTTQGLIRRLSFGGLVLLQPELLDAYAAAILDAARSEPDGLGTIAEDDVLRAAFRMPQDQRAQPDDERFLIIATVEELLRAELALREHTEAGSFLVFPSELTRDWPQTPDLPQLTTVFSFEGSIGSVYATLVVRLSRSGRFTIDARWRTAATFNANTGGVCGIVVRGEEALGEMGVFYSEAASNETRFQFEEFLKSHLESRASPGTIARRRVFVCEQCGEPLSEGQVTKRRAMGLTAITCPVCDQQISLKEWLEDQPGAVESEVPAMDDAADQERELQANVAVLEGKRATDDFDVFMCHNSADKDEVKIVGEALKERGVLPWLDEWELRPGLPWQTALENTIDKIKAAAVFVGASGLGPWQDLERQAFLSEFVRRGCPVIPVLLESAPAAPKVPAFLGGMTWVDFRKDQPDPLAQLVWGITGKHPLLGP